MARDRGKSPRRYSCGRKGPVWTGRARLTLTETTMLLMLDNYDSFTYNLVHYFGELGEEVVVVRNDQTTLEAMDTLNPDRICISPGPCSPAEAGISVDLIQHFAGSKPILGVCLGHQAIGVAFGAKIIRAKTLMHGKTS